MFVESTIDKLIQMRLSPMAHALREQDKDPQFASMSFDERFSMLVDAEYDVRRENKRTRLFRASHLPEPDASIADVRYYPDRKLNKEQLQNLARCTWVKEHQNIFLTGASGCGKTWLGSAFSAEAIIRLHSVLYVRMPKLLDSMAQTRDEIWLKEKRRCINCEVLFIDDFLLEPINKAYSRELLEVIEARYKKGSLIICSQFPVSGWHENIASKPLADAVCDRLAYNSHIIHIQGEESMRKRMFQKECTTLL